MNMQRGFDKRYCENFQAELTYDKIDNIWKSFREAGNSIEGRIVRNVLSLLVEFQKNHEQVRLSQ